MSFRITAKRRGPGARTLFIAALCAGALSLGTGFAAAEEDAAFDFDASFSTTRGIDRTMEATRGGFIVVPEAAPFVDMAERDVVLFERGTAELGPAALGLLEKLGRSATEGSLRGHNLQIEGHTCSVGATEYNLELSRRRAQMVTGFLVGQCRVARDRIRIVGYGETRPASSNLTPQDQAKNRRVRIVRLEQADEQRVTSSSELEEARTRSVQQGIAGSLTKVAIWGAETGVRRLRQLSNGDILPSDSLFKIRLHVFEGCHVFVALHGSSGNVHFLLPDAADENAQYGRWVDRTESGTQLGKGFVLPLLDNSYQLDIIPGTETIIVLAARKVAADLESLKNRIRIAAAAEDPGKTPFPDFDEFYMFKINHTAPSAP